MAAYADIILALLNRAASLSVGSPAMPIFMPERDNIPPAGPKYLQVDPFLNRPAWSGLAGGKVEQGLMQITVVWPRGQGLIAAAAAADAVCAHFPTGTRMRHGSASVVVTEDAWAASPISQDRELRIPVTIRWSA